VIAMAPLGSSRNVIGSRRRVKGASSFFGEPKMFHVEHSARLLSGTIASAVASAPHGRTAHQRLSTTPRCNCWNAESWPDARNGQSTYASRVKRLGVGDPLAESSCLRFHATVRAVTPARSWARRVVDAVQFRTSRTSVAAADGCLANWCEARCHWTSDRRCGSLRLLSAAAQSARRDISGELDAGPRVVGQFNSVRTVRDGLRRPSVLRTDEKWSGDLAERFHVKHDYGAERTAPGQLCSAPSVPQRRTKSPWDTRGLRVPGPWRDMNVIFTCSHGGTL
jgi:hypothetical protein